MRLRREDKIYANTVDGYKFAICNRDYEKVLGFNDDYFIYLKNVNFKVNGVIEGRYLGVASETLIDEYCKDVLFKDGEGFKADGKLVKSARMVAIDNKNKAVIIIES